LEASTRSYLRLLQDRFAPTTFCAGALEAPLDVVVHADAEWRRAIGHCLFRAADAPLPELLHLLGPLSQPLTKHLWVATASPRWTAYFDNGIDGSDPWPAISFLSERLDCRGILVAAHPYVRGSWRASTRFDLFGQPPVDELNLTRSISTAQEAGRWTWDATGDPLPFEDAASYAERRVPDRLPPDLVFRYARALGANLDAEGFYGRRGVIVEHRHVPIQDCRQETYEETRRRVGVR